MSNDEYSRKPVEDRIYGCGGDPTGVVESLPYIHDGEGRVRGGEEVSTNNLRRKRRKADVEGERELDCVEMMDILSGKE
jgi:hypothetical protein